MHKFTSGEFTMHVYGDLSDDIKIEEHGKLIATIATTAIRRGVNSVPPSFCQALMGHSMP